jgi:2-hydroxy-3-keto-5-methylthiopentenyl-1-phosphate phosphatase
VESVLAINKYMKSETILIGDSINDYEAAKENNLVFYGFNNVTLQNVSKNYISKFKDIEGI